jgi:membrane protease YdiL (CAAX protease family)
MFNRYWRTYPWFLQMTLVILMMITLASFTTYLLLVLAPKLSGLPFNEIANLTPASSPLAIRVGVLMQAVSHMGIFAIPALLFASFTHPRVREYLGLRAPGKTIHWLLATGIMLGLLPVFLWGEAWFMQHMHLGKWADEMQKTNDNTVKTFLTLSGSADLALLLFTLAFLPALGEELIFRGVLLRLMHRRVTKSLPTLVVGDTVVAPDVQRTMVTPVIFTALLFAAVHFNPYGFAFIFIAGCILALIYFLTGSLLCSIWAHLLYNGIQVSGIFFSKHNAVAKNITDGKNIPALVPLIGLAVFGICFYMLVRTQTPLKTDWSNDFRPGEQEPDKPDTSDWDIPRI